MKFNIYAIKDTEKGTFLQPWFVPFYIAEKDVVIDFTRNLKSAESVINKFPENFELFKIGEFMDETGMFIEGEKKLIASAADLLKEEEKDGVNNSNENQII